MTTMIYQGKGGDNNMTGPNDDDDEYNASEDYDDEIDNETGEQGNSSNYNL